MRIVDFSPCHISQAHALARRHYAEERAAVPALPNLLPPPPDPFAQNGLGVAAFEGERLLGFLGCYTPWENAFTGTARGTFSPLEAHGAISEQRESIYRLLYRAAAEKWVRAGIASHSIALYAHDFAGLRAFFTCGFGLRCVDAVRSMEEISGLSDNRQTIPEDITFTEAGKAAFPSIAPLGVQLTRHLAESPCFMRQRQEETPETWLAGQKERDSRLFIASHEGRVLAFLEVAAEGENFAAHFPGMANICGAYCLPQYRGLGIMPRLLNVVLRTLRQEGYTQLGVDYESFNLAAQAFWPKYFTPYTNGVVRRIDENIFQ